MKALGPAAEAQRIRILKSLFGWAVEKELVDRNPLMRKLRAETQTRPAQWKRSKVIPIEDAAVGYGRLGTPYSDALLVLFGTGWHARELVRFTKDGTIEIVPQGREGEGAAVLVTPRTKAGNPLRTIVGDSCAAAARRLRARGGLSGQYLRRAIEAACKGTEEKLRFPRSSPGESATRSQRTRRNMARSRAPSRRSSTMGRRRPTASTPSMSSRRKFRRRIPNCLGGFRSKSHRLRKSPTDGILNRTGRRVAGR